MAQTNIGVAWVQVKPSLSGISTDIKKALAGASVEGSAAFSKNLSSVFNGLGDNVKSVFSSAFNTVATTAKVTLGGAFVGVAGILKSSLSNYANYEQLVGGVETLFKESSGKLIDYANNAYKTAQLSANDYMETVTSFSASLLQSLGGDTKKAVEYANRAVIDMADNANKMGTSMESIQYAYQGFAKQNYTMLDNLKLGYGGTKTEMERLIKDAAKMTDVQKELGVTVDASSMSFGNIVNAIGVVQKSLGIAGTSAEEAAHTISGSLNMMKAAWKNLTTGMADSTQDMDVLIMNFTSSFGAFASNIMPSIQTALVGIVKVFGSLGPKLVESLPGVLGTLMPALLNAITGIFDSLVSIFPSLIGTLVDSIKELLSNSEQVSKIVRGMVALFAAVAGAAGEIVLAIIPLIPQIISDIVAEISKPENAAAVVKGFGVLFGVATFKTVATNISGMLKNTIGNKISSFFSKDVGDKAAKEASSSMKKVSASLKNGVTSIGQGITSALSGLKNILVEAVNVIVEPLKTALKGVGEAIAGFFKAFADPAIAVGALMFAAAAAAVAAAIVLIGGAVGLVMPVLQELLNTIIVPMAEFIVSTVLVLIDTLTNSLIRLTNEAIIPLGIFLRDTLVIVLSTITDSIIRLTNEAIIPLGTFLLTTFVVAINTVTDAITRLANDAIIPLINTLSGAFINVLTSVANTIVWVTNAAVIPLINTLSGAFLNVINTVANAVNTTLRTAFDGITGIIDSVGDAFLKMGQAIKTALDGASGVIASFRDLIVSIGDAVIAVVALATHQSVTYGHGFAHVTAAAMGGRVFGIGTDTSDSNLYALSKGEYVIRAASARKIGYNNLDNLNRNGEMGNSVGGVQNYFTINGYNKDPEELANIVSRKIALQQRGVL